MRRVFVCLYACVAPSGKSTLDPDQVCVCVLCGEGGGGDKSKRRETGGVVMVSL